jgi:hypothetical protein
MFGSFLPPSPHPSLSPLPRKILKNEILKATFGELE